MKLKAEFNPCNAGSAAAGGSEVSFAEQPSANPADPMQGTQSDTLARVRHVATLRLSFSLLFEYNYSCLCAGGAAAYVHCPQIDTHQLDRQIKAIMTKVIPFLKVGTAQPAAENGLEIKMYEYSIAELTY